MEEVCEVRGASGNGIGAGGKIAVGGVGAGAGGVSREGRAGI